MDYKIKWSPSAASHLEQICEFIAQDSKAYARVFAQKLLTIVENIPLFPKAGRIVPEYYDDNLREHIYGNYRIVYRIESDAVEIIAICHGARPVEQAMGDIH
ncbi:type II toxin-antitoxin system RelE/ParE family toxin [bacterium]|nr:type II toxin-antitoxin system RelE/ParE family toxin [bacterium]